MVRFFNNLLAPAGLSGRLTGMAANLAAVLAVILICGLAAFLTRKLLLASVRIFVEKSRNQFDNALLKHKFFLRLSHIVPAQIVYLFAPAFPAAQEWIKRLSLAYILVICVLTASALINAADEAYQTREISRHRPIKSYLQSAKILLFFITAVIIIANLMGSSPWKFLSGIGALSAVLLLIFKDAILGLVAGFQLSFNNMATIGDWIEMPKYQADGDVVDISLTTVKVRNWDKTITTIPAYAMISESFKNWRGMSESGGRRIKRAINIDMNTIRICTPEMLERFQKFQLIRTYIKERFGEVEKFNREKQADTTQAVNGRRLTNIGCFRAYIVAYLRQHPKIHKNMTFLVRQLDPAEHGLPLQIYVFSNDQVWANYESIQADIFDHLLAVVREFDLRVFQRPSGNDMRQLSSPRADGP